MKSVSIYLLCFIAALFLLSGCATTKPKVQEQPLNVAEERNGPKEVEHKESKEQGEVSLEDRWGIKVLSIRQSAGGYMLDFRYRIIDPDKASQLMRRKDKPYLIDQASGARFMVPSSPKIGPMRQTSVKPIPNRNYFILFANPGKYVKPGNKVTVVIGEFKAEDLIVE